ncbi:DNA polymerase domain-containing protein [Candidatus Undinarchaeota archaeon]
MKFFLLDIDYRTEDNTTVRLFGKAQFGEEWKPVVLLDRRHQPYIYVLAPDLKAAEKELKEKPATKEDGTEITPVKFEIVKKNSKGIEREVLKAFFKSPGEVPAYREFVRDLGFESREDDIPFVRRYLVDLELEQSNVWEVDGKEIEADLNSEKVYEVKDIKVTDKLVDLDDMRIMSFDTEMRNPEGMPRPEIDPIIAVSFADNTGWEKVITWKEPKEKKDWVHVVKDEKELFEETVKTFKERDPDVIVTYNGDQFDFPYVEKRAEVLKVKLELGRGSSGIKFSSRGRFHAAKISGRLHIDLYHIVFNILRGSLNLPRYTLEHVTNHIFGTDKQPFQGDMWKVWDDGKELNMLMQYTREDADATAKLALEFFPLQLEFARLVRNPIFDVSRMTSGQLVESLLLNKAHLRNDVAPSRPHSEERTFRREEGMIQGAYVRDPIKGLHENIAVLDFRSLYPTVIISHNIGPDMLNCECCSEKERTKVPGMPHYFCTKKRGLLPAALEELLEERTEIKSRMKKMDKDTKDYKRLDAEQYALKLFLNSAYGYLGYAGSRWHSRECAESVTAFGRHFIQDIMNKAEKEGFEVIYGDTDSLFFGDNNEGKDA